MLNVRTSEHSQTEFVRSFSDGRNTSHRKMRELQGIGAYADVRTSEHQRARTGFL
ncbi:hypothetical protein SXCC_00556 [Gluconacetobacter sp. SXCC-1]|nr:hypothetical protein SXCC_00556 [Gluconacetobacter sp. SXCC-1]